MLLLSILPAASLADVQGAAVTLIWDANPELNIAGYRLYYGTNPGIYTQEIDVGNSTMATVPNLQGGTIYFFAATAYDVVGVESAVSNEVPYAPPSQTPTPTASPTPNPTPSPTPTPGEFHGLANVSTRLFVQSGDNVMIGGFIIAGDNPKQVILRAIGPSLSTSGVSGAMPDPALRLFDSSGSAIASNDDWRSDQSLIIQNTGLAPSDDREAALVTTLPQGAYTAVLFDQTSIAGVALFEFYDLDHSNSQLTNLSTRGYVDIQDRVMIGGFIINGDHPTNVILRAIGPSLSQNGILDPLLDPSLELHNADGSIISQNDNWRSDQEQLILHSNLAPSDDRESAIIATLPPGPYSAIVRGSAHFTGTALFEIYKLSQ